MRAVLYARVSTLDQNVELQIDAMKEYCIRNKIAVVKTYVDNGVSGIREDRKALKEFLREAEKIKPDRFIVWKLDRLGRNLRHLLHVLSRIDSWGIKFVSITENIDVSTPSGELMMQVLGALSQYERSMIRERILLGQAAARARGSVFGRPSMGEPDPARARELRDQGKSYREIAKEMKNSLTKVYFAINPEKKPEKENDHDTK
jgi:DNA invertase Pin-like site-specific DNA recombinase